MRIAVGPQVLGSVHEAVAREWLVADGRGGFAMGTVAGLRTRRYHGLLVAAGEPVGRRRLLLADLPATLVVGTTRVPLSTVEVAPGRLHPAGHQRLVGFDLDDGVPRWRWQVGPVVVEREVAAAPGIAAVGVVHRLVRAPGPVRLEVAVWCADRDSHGEQLPMGIEVEAVDGGIVVNGTYRLWGPGFRPTGRWHGVHLREERARGYTADEHLFEAGACSADLEPGGTLEVVAWAGDLADVPAPAIELVEAARAGGRTRAAAGHDGTDGLLLRAAAQFVVTTPEGPGIVAGYPWFGEWSRDTMISLDGLLLQTGRYDDSRALLRRWAATLDAGQLANTTDSGAAEHNTVDGTLWFLHAVGRHVAAAGDLDLAAELLPALDRVLEHHLAGTRHGIQVDPADGLLTQGEDGLALTWMDARYRGWCVTPRPGKPVEVEALWINGLAVVDELRARTGAGEPRWARLATAACRSFDRRFRSRPRRSEVAPDLVPDLVPDVVDGPGGDDSALRPNQLLAGALPHGPGLDATAVAAVRNRLLTPLGLRTLDPAHADYRGHHRGTLRQRDEAYHQGTVWPWLLGPYVDAARRAGVDPTGTLDAVDAHLAEWGLGSVSETADGDAPHHATGCPFQAWSVAEVLRARRLLGR